MINQQVPRNPKFRLAEKQALENKYLLQQLVLNADTVRFSIHF